MKKVCLWAAAFVGSLILLSGTARGEEAAFPRYAQAVIQKMGADSGDGTLVDIGISFASMDQAKQFSSYFYRSGYWGEEPVRVALRTWQDRPSSYELHVSVADAQLAAAQHREAEARLKEVSDAIAGAAQGERARAEAAYDWIYDHIEYDYSLQSRSVYRALTTGKTICSGYAEIFRVLCKNLGMSCEILYGDNHVWNRVLIDGSWSYADITWDKNLGEHRWRLVSEEEWNETHVLKEGTI